jgi:O-antigen ligase
VLRAKIRAVSGLVIEAGVSFLLFFTPFAFGGVEGWALGVLQIVAGVVTAAWALDRLSQRGAIRIAGGRAGLNIRVPIVLFILLVCVQLVPLPAGVIGSLSPATHSLYAMTIPGYAEGRRLEPEDLVPWLLEDRKAELPAAESGETLERPNPPFSDPLIPPAPARRTVSIYPYDTRTQLTVFLSYAGIFAAVLSHYTTRERLQRLLLIGSISAAAVSLLGIAQKLTWNEKLYWIREGHYLNSFGPFVDRNTYAAFAGVWMPVAAAMALSAARKVRERGSDHVPSLLLWGAASVLLAGGTFFCLSRAGILCAGLAIGLLAMLLLYYGRAAFETGLLVLLVLSTVAFLFYLGPEKVFERVGTLSEGRQVPSLQLRVNAWGREASLIQQNPVLGTGLGTFRFAFTRYSPPGQSWQNVADNEYLELLCDTGLAGGILLLWGAGTWLWRVARPARMRGRPERHLYIGMVAGLAALLVHSAISSNLHVPANGLLIPVLGAALLNLMALPSRRAAAESGSPRATA